MVCDAFCAFSVDCAYSAAVNAYRYVTENIFSVNTAFACLSIVVC